MVNQWERVSESGAIGLCLLKEAITLRISLPEPQKFTIIGEGTQVAVYGERYSIEALNLPGGRCSDKFYRIKGTSTNAITGSGNLDCGVLFSDQNANGQFRGAITLFEEFEKINLNPDGSIQAIDYFFRLATEDNPIPGEFRSEWQFAFADMNPDCYNQFGIDPEQVEQGDRYLFAVPISRSGGDTVQYLEWERVDGTSREQDELECPSQGKWRVQVFDCNEERVFNGIFNGDRPIVKTDPNEGYFPPEYLEIPLNNIMGVNVLFFTDQTTDPIEYVVRLSIFAPLVPPDSIPDLDPEEPGNGSDVGFREIVSPECTNRWAKIEYICGRCEVCPSGTVCSIQIGNIVCCYNKEGQVIAQIEGGCFEPDFKCD